MFRRPARSLRFCMRLLSLRPRVSLGPLAAIGCLLALPVAAQQAVVRSYDAPELEVGQAWLMHSAERCLALLPLHVAAETALPALLREGSPALRGEATDVIDLGDDAAVATMTGNITKRCGAAVGSISRNLDRLLRSNGLGTLRTVNGDGTLARLAVTIVDDDGRDYLRVLPTNDREQIRKGQSGSLLIVDDRTAGMLLSVHASTGVGTVMRTDTLLAKLDAHLRNRTLPMAGTGDASQQSGSDAEAPSAGAGPWHVTGWNADPIGSDHAASVLTAAGTKGFWAAQVDRWPVALELGGPTEVRIVRGIEFVANGEIAPTQRPARVQVLSSVGIDRVAWRVARSGTLTYIDGTASLVFPPVRARALRIEVYRSEATSDEVALARLIVLEADD
jgi:hypothetical protein